MDPVQRKERPLQAGRDFGSLSRPTLPEKKLDGNVCAHLLISAKKPKSIDRSLGKGVVLILLLERMTWT